MIENGRLGYKQIKCELYNDNFQNYKNYSIPKAQLVIADLPYRLEDKAYASNPTWYNDGDNSNGESKHAHSSFFPSDDYFNIVEYFAFCNRLLRKDYERKTARNPLASAIGSRAEVRISDL